MAMFEKYSWLKPVVSAVAVVGLALAAAVLAADEKPRIITVGSSVTELVYALGAGEQVVAVDVTSQHPLAVQALPKVGYHRALSTEGVLSLTPDRLIGSEEMGPPPVLKQLRATDVEVDILTTDGSLENLYQRITQVAALLNQRGQGERLQARIRSEIAAADNKMKGQKPRVLFMLSHSGTPMVAGAGTTADTLIELAGGVNVAATRFEQYRQVSDESVLAMAPDVLLVTQSGDAQVSNAQILKMQPGLAMTPAGVNQRIFPVDGTLLVGGLGPRTGEAVLDLAAVFYPEN